MELSVPFNELTTKIERLPIEQRQEVYDFVSFLEARYAPSLKSFSSWEDVDFKSMSIDQAMMGLENESELYSDADLKERW